jgi:hypothetical protein
VVRRFCDQVESESRGARLIPESPDHTGLPRRFLCVARLCGGDLPTNRFDFRPTEREERFGKDLFGAEWEASQTEAELELLRDFRDPYKRYVGFEPEERPASAALEDWAFHGSDGKRQQANAAHARALKIYRQLAQVRRLLRVLDAYGPHFDPLQELASGDSFAELAKARDLYAKINKAHAQQSLIEPGAHLVASAEQNAETALPTAPAAETLEQSSQTAPPAARPVSSDARQGRRRGQKSKVLDRVKAEMHTAIREGRLTGEQLDALPEKAMESDYKASRDTCRRARAAVLEEIGYVRASDEVQRALETLRNSDK